MKICPNCGWENDDDFNFCLGCGSQLPETGSAPSAPPTSPPSSPPAAAASPTPPPASTAPPAANQPQICSQCGSTVPVSDKFCGQCGNRMDPPAPPPAPAPVAPAPAPTPPPEPVAPPSPARLVLLLPNGQEGGSYPLKPNKTEIGRTQGNILFLDDPYVSPLHATFLSNNGKLTVRNEQSFNGLFIRLTQRRDLKHNDVLLLGKQLLRFEVLHAPEDDQIDLNDAAQTAFWGSPPRPYWGRIVQLIAGGSEGNAILLGGNSVELGRERGQITFPGDRFISSIHARISHENGTYVIEDLGSRNGTFICVHDEYPLSHNDILIVGEQLLRVELSS